MAFLLSVTKLHLLNKNEPDVIRIVERHVGFCYSYYTPDGVLYERSS